MVQGKALGHRRMAPVIIAVTAVALMALAGCAPPDPVSLAQPPRNMILISKKDQPQASELRDADAEALRDRTRAPDVARVTPVVMGSANVATQQRDRAPIIGSTPDYLAVAKRWLAVGAVFTDKTERVAVIGPALATSLFNGDARAALNSTVRVGRVSFQIIGVLEADGKDDDVMIMPLMSARSYLFGYPGQLSLIIVESTSPGTVNSALAQVHTVLDDRRLVRDPATRDYTAVIR